MRFIEPNVEYWPQESGIDGMWKQIARATRICYQAFARENETDEQFVKRVIFKPALIEGDLNDLHHCKFDNLKLHGGCLEHGTLYFKILYKDTLETRDNVSFLSPQWNAVMHSQYVKFNKDIYPYIYLTTNLRFIVENRKWGLLKDYLCEPTEYHAKRYTFNVITDIGVTRELNRHRANSICEESSRYNAYDKGKYGSELTYVKPAWYDENNSMFVQGYADANDGFKTLFLDLINDVNNDLAGDWSAPMYYAFGLLAAEFAYMGMRKCGEPAERCRQVLNLNTKTQAVYSAFAQDWQHFLALRADNASGRAHPNIKIVANKIKEIAEKQKLW